MCWKKLLKVIAAIIALPALAVEVYMYWPDDVAIKPLSIRHDATTLVLLFHGAGGVDGEWQHLREQVERKAGAHTNMQVENIIWWPWSADFFRAAVSGEKTGRQIGAQVAAASQVNRVHLIATSAGSYALRPLCEAIRATAQRQVFVKMTFLDPVGVKGLLDFNYGSRHYGRCADDAEVVFNRDDYVPGSNSPLPAARSLDVTHVPERQGYRGDGHAWPVRYYADVRLQQNDLL